MKYTLFLDKVESDMKIEVKYVSMMVQTEVQEIQELKCDAIIQADFDEKTDNGSVVDVSIQTEELISSPAKEVGADEAPVKVSVHNYLN